MSGKDLDFNQCRKVIKMVLNRVRDYLTRESIEIEDGFLKYLESGKELTDNDEFKHNFGTFPARHNESWYFNFLDFEANVQVVTRVSYQLGEKESDVLMIIVIDGKTNLYANRLKVDGFPENDEYGDKKVKFKCIKPHKKWQITFSTRKHEMDVIFEGRFAPFNSLSYKDPVEFLEKHGIGLLKISAQQHYEQAMRVTGTIKFKKKGELLENRQINCLGHRDHSWGTRDWVNIDKWNWVTGQFDDFTVNAWRVEALDKVLKSGFISTADGNEPVTDVEVVTEYGIGKNERAPKSSVFKLKTPTRQITLESTTWKSLRLVRPSEGGIVEIYEQIAKFKMNRKVGVGISEYMDSIKEKIRLKRNYLV